MIESPNIIRILLWTDWPSNIKSATSGQVVDHVPVRASVVLLGGDGRTLWLAWQGNCKTKTKLVSENKAISAFN